MKKEDLSKLSDPNVHIMDLNITPMWRQDAKVGGKRQIVPYYTADQCREILDFVCSIDGWANEYVGINNITFCNIGINVDDNWIFKCNSGGAKKSTKQLDEVDHKSYQDKTTATNSFVRASETWGIGRHLKLLPPVYLEIYSKNVKTPKGIELTTPEEITAYCNNISTSEGWLSWIYRANKSAFEADKEALGLMANMKEVLRKFKK